MQLAKSARSLQPKEGFLPRHDSAEAQSLLTKFRLALDAAVSAHQSGYITDEELDGLIREMVAMLIAVKLDAIVSESIAPAIYPHSRGLRRWHTPRRAVPARKMAHQQRTSQ